jgi:hypothetical protein
MKARTALSLAVAVIGLSPAASAQTRARAPHAETASALKCLLDHVHDRCDHEFVGSARRPAQFWLWWTPTKDMEFGRLLSSEYAGTESQNAYTTRFLEGRTADVYDVKFAHGEQTFYIVPPDPDGNIHYLRIRGGAPDDEKLDLFVHGPG